MTRVLIIEDEERISAFISKGLKVAEIDSLAVRSAAEGFLALRAGQFDVVVLDIGLPDEDGLSLLKRIRAAGNPVPVIVLTARTSIDDTVASLEGGADDYMAKPFAFAELLARIKLRVRTEEQAGNMQTSTLVNGPLRLELLTRRFFVDGAEIELSTREFDLAHFFMENVDLVLSREQLLARVWGYDFDPGSNVVDVYVRYLRNKIGTQWFSTVRGVGYRMPRSV